MRTASIILSLLLTCATAFAADKPELVFIGTYTNFDKLSPPRRGPAGEASKGIYAFRFDPGDGKLTPLGLAGETFNPTFIAFHPRRPILYAVNEIYEFEGKPSGAVSAFAIDPESGKLTFLNQVPSQGTGACHLVVDREAKNLLLANFGSGSVAVIPIDEQGKLKPASAFVQETGTGPSPRQAGPHSHSINLSPDNRFAITAQFGGDRLNVYRFDSAAGSITPNDPPFLAIKPGSAPRHFAFGPDGKSAYVLNEIANTVIALAYDSSKGSFSQLQTISTLPADFSRSNTSAEVQVHPSGKFLYTSNRGHNSIAIFAVASDGRLSSLGFAPTQGRTPRNFSLDPDGRWLIVANQDTNNLTLFRVNTTTGQLAAVDSTFTVPAPLCVRFWRGN